MSNARALWLSTPESTRVRLMIYAARYQTDPKWAQQLITDAIKADQKEAKTACPKS